MQKQAQPSFPFGLFLPSAYSAYHDFLLLYQRFFLWFLSSYYTIQLFHPNTKSEAFASDFVYILNKIMSFYKTRSCYLNLVYFNKVEFRIINSEGTVMVCFGMSGLLILFNKSFAACLPSSKESNTIEDIPVLIILNISIYFSSSNHPDRKYLYHRALLN